MEFKEIIFGSQAYEQAVALRYAVLRKPLGLTFDPAQLAKEGEDHHLCTFTNSGEMMACLIMVPLENSEVKMRQFAVDDRHQLRGIGKALVDFAEEWSKLKGFAKIVLNARKSAVPFYLKQGYITEGEEFNEVGIPHYFMYKYL